MRVESPAVVAELLPKVRRAECLERLPSGEDGTRLPDLRRFRTKPSGSGTVSIDDDGRSCWRSHSWQLSSRHLVDDERCVADDVEVVADAGAEEDAERFVGLVVAEDVERGERVDVDRRCAMTITERSFEPKLRHHGRSHIGVWKGVALGLCWQSSSQSGASAASCSGFVMTSDMAADCRRAVTRSTRRRRRSALLFSASRVPA